MDSVNTRESIAAHCARYPLLQPEDLLKFLHQSTFGGGHLVRSIETAEAWLREELQQHTAAWKPEALDGDFCRVPLGALRTYGVEVSTFARLFALSARMPTGSVEALEARLQTALEMARDGLLPFSQAALSAAAESWHDAGYPATHHSEAFRAAYSPAYRVLHRRHAALLPLLGAIDQGLARQARFLVAIDGGAGSGKTTLAQLLREIYSCTLVHMDDFFLQSHQRTAERYATPGGNIDHERFSAEVLTFLRQGDPFLYRPFDCATFTVQPGEVITPTALTVVEGSYSLHPTLRQHYDLRVFLHIDPQLQRQRILQRNSPDFAQMFFRRWIPLEQAYFDACDPAGSCDLILEAES